MSLLGQIGDRIVEVDGENVSLENHSQVVRRIAGAGSTLREGLKKILKVRNFPYRLGRGGSKLVKFSPFLIFFNPSFSLLVVDSVCEEYHRTRNIVITSNLSHTVRSLGKVSKIPPQ